MDCNCSIFQMNSSLQEVSHVFALSWHMCEEPMLTNFEFSIQHTCKNPCLTHRQDAQCWQRYEHISSSTGPGTAGHSACLTRFWVTLVLTTPCEGRRHQLSCCCRETDVAYCHDEIREPIYRRQITHMALWTMQRKHSKYNGYLIRV